MINPKVHVTPAEMKFVNTLNDMNKLDQSDVGTVHF